MFPSDAAVIPLPSEETTPPVTKTYFDIGDLQGGFSNLTGSEPFSNTRPSPRPSPLWGEGSHPLGSALGSRSTSFVSYSPDDAWRDSFASPSPGARPRPFR